MPQEKQYWHALDVGGIFISDDIGDNLAFFHFCKMVSASPIVINNPQSNGVTKYVGILEKKSKSAPRELLF